MKCVKYLMSSLLFAMTTWGSSFAQGGSGIHFASTAAIKVAFPVPESIILFFYSSRCESCNQDLEIYALVPKGNAYDRVFVGLLDTDGDPPIVESVFLKNVDGKPGGELFLLVSWASSHPGVGIFTKNYAVYIFGREGNGGAGLKRLTDIEEKIGQTSEGTVEGERGRVERVVAKYRNADDVKKILGSLGY